MRHQPDWGEVLAAFDDNEARILAQEPAEPMPEAEFCRQSPHRTLGHLTACQVAWLPLMRKIRDEAPMGNVAVHPLRLFEQLGYATMPWPDLMERFIEDRREWRRLLAEVDLERPLKLPARVHTAKTLTEKLVRHELGHLDDLEAQRAADPTAHGNALGKGASPESPIGAASQNKAKPSNFTG
jgi:hypothetical protein